MVETLLLSVREGPEVALPVLCLRLFLGLVAGAVVAALYRATRNGPGAQSLPATLVLLAVLIAAVTQVIGDNVARAFSLVGALSIVRFRTVVRDTRDTAFVIFAVVTGMAVGAGHATVALATVAIGGLAAWIMRPRAERSPENPEFELSVRVALGQDAEALVAPVLREHLATWAECGATTARQGAALEVTWIVTLRPGHSPAVLVTALNRVEGIQNIELRQRDAGG